MTVQCLNWDQKKKLYDAYAKCTYTKSEIAGMYAVSTRTVSRVIDEVESNEQYQDEVLNLTTKAIRNVIYDLYVVDELPEKEVVELMARNYATSATAVRFVINELESGELRADFFGEDDTSVYDELEEDVDDGDVFVSEDDEECFYTFVLTPDSLSITKMDINGDDVDTVNIDNTHEKFSDVFQMILQDSKDQSVIREAYEMLNIKTYINNITSGKVTVYPQEYRITYTNDGGSIGEFSGNLVSRIVEGALNHGDVNHLIKFADRLAGNPSYRAVNELYEFLEATDININEDGYVECFKRVNGDSTDVYSRTFDNSVGKVVQVPRNMVDEDSERTCSYGLHVCSKAYLNSYSGSKIIKVLVDPADFVAIPKDYYGTDENNQVKAKARVCKYKVVEDITEDYRNGTL